MKEQEKPDLKKILIVEDDPHSQLYFKKLLSGSYNIFTAISAREAWESINKNNFDLVLMDISLSGGEDGLSLTRRIRNEPSFKSLLILAVTAYAFPEDRRRALDAGCNDYLSKPVNNIELQSKVEEMLRS